MYTHLCGEHKKWMPQKQMTNKNFRETIGNWKIRYSQNKFDSSSYQVKLTMLHLLTCSFFESSPWGLKDLWLVFCRPFHLQLFNFKWSFAVDVQEILVTSAFPHILIRIIVHDHADIVLSKNICTDG